MFSRLLDVHSRFQFGNENDLHGLMTLFRISALLSLGTMGFRSIWEGWLHNRMVDFTAGVVLRISSTLVTIPGCLAFAFGLSRSF